MASKNKNYSKLQKPLYFIKTSHLGNGQPPILICSVLVRSVQT